jgi:hypothetical protein
MQPPRPLDYAAPRPPPAPDGGRAVAGLVFAGSLLAGLACVLVAMMLTGAGHGWSSAFAVSWVAVVASPLSAVDWALRRRVLGKGIAVLLICGAVVSNSALVDQTRSEATYYFDHAWSSAPGVMTAWVALWASWQVLSVIALLSPPGGTGPQRE